MRLTEFLLARIAEDEARSGGDAWHALDCERNSYAAGPCDCDVPTRVLAECDAKRRIVDLNTWVMHGARFTFGPDSDEVLSILALPYADHPDYREEWKL